MQFRIHLSRNSVRWKYFEKTPRGICLREIVLDDSVESERGRKLVRANGQPFRKQENNSENLLLPECRGRIKIAVLTDFCRCNSAIFDF